MRYRVLGPVAATADGASVRLGGPKQRLVLALLLRDADRVVGDGRLVDALWGDERPGGARHTIQTYVSELRRILDDEIVREGSGYRLAVDVEAVDAHRFEALVAAGRERIPDAPDAAAALFRDALGLWRGEPYADLADADVMQDEIHRLQQARLEAVEDRLHAELQTGRHASATIELDALARDHPYRERIHGLLMLALYRSGRQAEALRAYERLRTVLATDLGIDPSPELQQLHLRILNQDDALLGVPTLTAADGTEQVVRGFELRNRLERQGPVTVWRAYQPAVSREVLVTVVGAHEANAPAFVRRFEPHAQRLTRVEHPHLLPVLDHWRDPRGAYLVSPLAAGGSVRSSLVDGAWTPSAALRLIEQVGDAVTALHRADLIHGHLGAAVVLLGGEGNALVDPVGVLLPPTAATGVVAPEVRRGGSPDVAVDVYGLACLALEVLSGAPPPLDAPASVLGDVPAVLPRDAATVLGRATSDDPSARPRQIGDLVRDLRRAMGADVVALGGGEPAGATRRNPYKGLRAFEEADAEDFHGREALVEELLAAVAEHPFVAVVGPSGSGKSSAVRAGLIPALRDGGRATAGGRLFTDLFPGAHPFEELEAALMRVAVDEPEGLLADLLADERGMARAIKQILPADTELVLVIDQFEELYSLTRDAELRRLFLDGLATLADDGHADVRTIITLRADFFDRPLQHHGLGALVRRGLVTVGMPSPQELARAVSQPAHQVGVVFEPGLVETIVRDVSDQPGALPLLQHALTELFERREGHLLTGGGYRSTGGVLGALGRRAEELYQSMPPRSRTAAQQVLLRLVAVDDRHEDARRRVRRAEFVALEADAAAVDDVIRLFGAHRLLSFDRDPVTRSPTVEVAHEALFHAWPRLRSWIEGRREDLLLHRRLAAAVSEWHQAGESPDYLMAGGRLEQFERWAAATQLVLTTRERAYLDASRSYEDAGTAKRHRRRRLVVGVVAVAAVLATMLALAASLQGQRARRGERAALSRGLATASRLQQALDPDLAVLLALEAVDVAPEGGRPSRDAIAALHEAVLAHRLIATVDAGGTLVAPTGADDRVFVSGPPSNEAAIWDLGDGGVEVLRRDGRAPFQMASSADGSRAVETFVGQPTLVWDLGAAELLTELPATTPFQLWPALSPDGRTLAVANLRQFGRDEDQTISLWDLDTGEERLRFPHEGNARDLAFSPDALVLAVADMQNAVVRLYDTASGDVLRTIGDPTDPRGVDSVAFHPSGDQLTMFVFTPRELRIVDLTTDEVVHRAPMGTAALGASVCYSGDGETLAVASGDELLNVHDASGNLRIELPGSGSIGSLACGRDGDSVVIATDDGVVRLWGLGADVAGEVLSIAAPAPFTGSWTPAGDALLTTHYGSALVPDSDRPVTGTLHRYDAASGELLAEVDGLHPFPPWWLLMSPDGRYVVTLGNPFGDTDPAEAPVDVPRYARLVIHDAVTLKRVGTVEPGGWPLAFAPTSTELLVGDPGRARTIDVDTGRTVTELTVAEGRDGDPPPEVGGGGFLDGGRHVVLVSGGAPNGWIVDLPTREVVATFCVEGAGHVAVSPDGRSIAVAAGPETIQLWDAAKLLDAGQADCGEDRGVAPVRTLRANAGMGLAFSPTGSALAAAGRDGVVTVWDLEDGEPLLRVRHPAEIGGAAFSPDGRHVLVTVNDAGGTQHAVRVYTLDTEELIAIARETVTRHLTPEECRRFLLRPCP